jgi:predicted acetyltransferase
MAEFFILRRYRNNGIGSQAAHAAWRRFPGSWQVRVMLENPGARIFWARAIASFLGKSLEPAIVEADGEIRAVFSFSSSPKQ